MGQANQRQADEIMLATLAGFFAGEGCVSIRRACKAHKTPTVIVELGNTEKMWCELFQQYFGGSVRTYFPKRYKNSLPYYHWTIKNEKAGEFVQAIAPYLIGEKKQQMEIALKLVAIKALHPDRHLKGAAGHFTPEETAAMVQLESELRELRRAVAETKRTSAQPVRSDSPIPQETAAVLG